MYDFENMTDEEFELLCMEKLPVQHEAFRIINESKDRITNTNIREESIDDKSDCS